MYIFIDESGTFVSANQDNLWNCVAAYMVPETEKSRYSGALEELKRRTGFKKDVEVKLGQVSEENYIRFLTKLGLLGGVLFCVAIDSGINPLQAIKNHRNQQADILIEHLNKMVHESAKSGLRSLSAQIRNLSPQLYVQMHCQVQLIYDVLNRGILYFVQRHPEKLSNFKWRIDQKNTTKTKFEDSFQKIAPGILQTISLRKPMISLIGADYTSFSRFEYGEDDAPTYLQDVYGINIDTSKNSINIGKLMSEDIKFHDSKNTIGIQVVDLLASGIRKCLRNHFDNNHTIAHLIGNLFVSPQKGDSAIKLIGFQDVTGNNISNFLSLSSQNSAYRYVKIINNHSRALVL